MVKNTDWNMAFLDDQDTRALMSSEVFRNLLSIHNQKKYAEQKMVEKLPPPILNFENEITKKANEEISDDYYLEDTSSENSEEEEEHSEPAIEEKAISYKKNDDLYETGAGESSHIDIGITTETQKLLENGIDYIKYDIVEHVTQPKEPKEDSEEIKKAEKDLGLDKNAFYIYRKMMAKRA